MSELPGSVDPNVLLGLDAADDAAIFRISDELALVQTADFFTPVVDDPKDWGAIAAANAFSDVYAMGGKPVTALNLVGWPADLDFALLADVLKGGFEKAREAGASVVGGHTVDDPEPKYGMAVTGLIDPSKVVTASSAKPGMKLFLTKPLGMGIIATAIKRESASPELEKEAVQIMSALNANASQAMLDTGAGAATDVTGFGLIGHLSNMLNLSGAAARISSSAVPVIDGVAELAFEGMVPGGTRRNEKHFGEQVRFDESIDPETRIILFDAQTSGGLLIAVDESRAETLGAKLSGESVLAAEIGEIIDGEAGAIEVRE